VAYSNLTSKATIGTGTALLLTGKLDAKATLAGTAITSAKGDASGSSAAVGVALALTIAIHDVESFTLRSITAGGIVSFQALGSSNRSSTT
jgi:hypothetical protein